VGLEVGRNAESWGRGSLVLSDHAPTLDMVRLTTDRSLWLHGLGATDLTLFAADLGTDRVFAHTRLYGIRIDVAPASGVRIGLSVLDRQGGAGAPAASWGRRLKDLLLPWTGGGADPADELSDKIFGIDVRLPLPGTRGGSLEGEMASTYLEKGRLSETLGWGGAYRATLTLPRLGSSQRHGLEVEAATVGPYMYRHHVFATGSAVDGFLLGSPLGPDARGAWLRYAYHTPRAALSAEVGGERRRGDGYVDSPAPAPTLLKVLDLPDEDRLLLRVGIVAPVMDGAGSVDLSLGFERVAQASFTAGRDTNHWALRLRIRRGF
jgi:hypothetical protein